MPDPPASAPGSVQQPPAASVELTREDVQRFDPGGLLPDCTAIDASRPSSPESRFLALRASEVFEDPARTYLVEVDNNGPGKLYDVGPSYTAPLSTVGRWSDDGRYFAFSTPGSNPATSHGGVIAAVHGGEEPILSTFEGAFLLFAPTRTSFVAPSSPGVLRFSDAAKPDEVRAVQLPDEFLQAVRWSSDGRFLAVALQNAPQMLVIDTDADELTAVPIGPVATLVSTPLWSPSGHRLAYASWDGDKNRLLLVDPEHPDAEAIELSAELDNVNSALENNRWLDAERILIDDKSGELRVADLSSSPATSTTVAKDLTDGFSVLPGGRCLLYRGRCAPDGSTAACVRSLDRGASAEARAIFPSPHYSLQFSAQGSPVVFVQQVSKLIVEVALDGGGYEPQVVTANEHERLFEGGSVSPATGAPWVYYLADSAPYLWNRSSERTFALDGDSGLSYDVSGSFAPDGQFLALLARDPGFPPVRAPLMIQSLDDASPLQHWAIDRFMSLGRPIYQEVAWQPR
jgi:dipeptidyl aminopeptidase/acylaminoacyl peptidase